MSRKTILLLPGSRSTEIKALMPVLEQTARLFAERNGTAEFLLPTVPRQAKLVEELAAGWSIRPHITTATADKWAAFADADMAIAASGTVTLELALCGVPTVSIYKTDWLMSFLTRHIKVWSASLPNLIADRPVVPEHINELARPGYLCRWAECLSEDSPQRRAMLEGFDLVWKRLATPVPSRRSGGGLVLDLLIRRGVISGEMSSPSNFSQSFWQRKTRGAKHRGSLFGSY